LLAGATAGKAGAAPFTSCCPAAKVIRLSWRGAEAGVDGAAELDFFISRTGADKGAADAIAGTVV